MSVKDKVKLIKFLKETKADVQTIQNGAVQIVTNFEILKRNIAELIEKIDKS